MTTDTLALCPSHRDTGNDVMRTAAHEVGHALAARVLGGKVLSLKLDTEANGSVYQSGLSADSPEQLRDALTFSAAGVVAVALTQPDALRVGPWPTTDTALSWFYAAGGAGDYSAMTGAVRRLHGLFVADDVVSREVLAAVERARVLLLDHRDEFEALAHALLTTWRVWNEIAPLTTGNTPEKDEAHNGIDQYVNAET